MFGKNPVKINENCIQKALNSTDFCLRTNTGKFQTLARPRQCLKFTGIGSQAKIGTIESFLDAVFIDFDGILPKQSNQSKKKYWYVLLYTIPHLEKIKQVVYTRGIPVIFKHCGAHAAPRAHMHNLSHNAGSARKNTEILTRSPSTASSQRVRPSPVDRTRMPRNV